LTQWTDQFYDKNLFYGPPGDIFSALEHGVDVFDSSCAYSATERGCAVVFPVEHHAHGSSCSSSHEVSDGGHEGEGEKEGKTAGGEGGADSGVEAGLFEIDLNEERLEES
jgi:hypothetical protein